VSRGFSRQEGEDYDETLAPVIEEIVPMFVKIAITTMIPIQYEIQREQSLYLRLSCLHERKKAIFSINHSQFQMKLLP
jgi:hypothetical protein